MASAHSNDFPLPPMRAWHATTAAGGLQKTMQLIADARPPKSPPNAGYAIVRVHSTTINPVDYKLAEAPLLGKFIIGRGMTPGKDFSGVVVSISGGGSSDIKPGTTVFGTLDVPNRNGTLAEFVTAPIANITLVPDGLAPELAAAAPTVALTAYQSILPHIQIPKPAGNRDDSAPNNPKPKIFINGGSGGTGTFGIQIAKHILDAYVVTTCSAANVAFCEALGADEVLDYTKINISSALVSRGETFDLVVDNIGVPGDLYTAANHFLKPDGTFVQVGAGGDFSALLNMMSRLLLPGFLGGGKRRFRTLSAKPDRGSTELKEIATWMAEGKVKVEVDGEFGFEAANRAVERVKTGRTRGKVVVRVAER